jgi:hypothetical protein
MSRACLWSLALVALGCQQAQFVEEESRARPPGANEGPAEGQAAPPVTVAPWEHEIPLTGEGRLEGQPVSQTPIRSANGVETRQQALTTNEATVMSATGVRMAGSATSAFVGSDGTWQTMIFGNTLSNVGSLPNGWHYGCIRNSTTQCNINLGINGLGSDLSTIIGGGFAYASRLTSTGGLIVMRTDNACNGSCGASWATCSGSVPADFPTAVSANASQFRFVFSDLTSGSNNWVSMGVLNWCSSFGWTGLTACNLGSDIRRNAHAVLGANGIVHVVYANRTKNRVEYTQFNTNTNTWNCAVKEIHDIIPPPNNCSGGQANRPILPILGNTATTKLEYIFAPRIARDATTGTLVVTWDSYDSTQGAVRSRAFRSTDGGVNWGWTLLTLQETFHSAVAVGPAHRFEIGNTYHFGLGNTGGQVSWKSTDAGASWSGTAISSSRVLAPVMGPTASRPCHWGDYEAVSWHAGNNAFFHTWPDTNQGPEAVIRGRFINQ